MRNSGQDGCALRAIQRVPAHMRDLEVPGSRGIERRRRRPGSSRGPSHVIARARAIGHAAACRRRCRGTACPARGHRLIQRASQARNRRRARRGSRRTRRRPAERSGPPRRAASGSEDRHRQTCGPGPRRAQARSQRLVRQECEVAGPIIDRWRRSRPTPSVPREAGRALRRARLPSRCRPTAGWLRRGMATVGA